VKFHLNRFLRRVRIHGGEFDTSARAMYRDEVVYPLQADLRIVRRSTIERKKMSTKTTFKRIALVAVAALGLGVLSVVPSQAEVSGLIVTTTNGTGATVLKSGESATAATIKVQFLALGTMDSVSVTIVPAAALPAGAAIAGAGLWLTESTTSTGTAPTVDTATLQSATAGPIVSQGAITPGSYFRVIAPTSGQNGTFSTTLKYSLGETATVGNTINAGTYSFNAIVSSTQSSGAKTDVYPFSITVAAIPVVVPVPSAAAATAYLQSGVSGWNFGAGTLTDSVTTGSLLVGTTIGAIKLTNLTAAPALSTANDTVTVTMTGVGYLTTTGVSAGNVTGRSFVIANVADLTVNILADGNSGEGKITMTTAAGASFVKTVTFYDTKPDKAVATVSKAYIKAGTTQVDKVFVVNVTDAAGTAVTNAVVTAAPTDTATTVGGAATCDTTYNTTVKGFYCHVKGLSTTKFGPVAYTIKATGADTAKTVVTTTATVTFADNVATKATLTGPASAAPGAEVEYTLTLTEKNGYPVADDIYGVGSAPGGVLFSALATGRVVEGWTGAAGPFLATDSFTATSGVIKSKGIMPLAGTAKGTWTLVGDGLQTASGHAIDKTIGKTTVTVSTEVSNAAVDAATAAAEAAEAAAQDATDAALDATTAAEAAGALAQEAVDAVAELSAEVTKLMAGVKAQITYLTKLVMRLAAK
jgi:hypothetical protein